MSNYSTAPDYVSWEITKKCNLNCKHCSNADNKNMSKDLSIDKCEDIIIQLRKAGVFRITLEGGEPFVRGDFLDIVKIANKYKYRPKVATNGTMITDELAKQLLGKVNLVQVSIDGPERIHNMIRKLDNIFDKSITGIKHLISNGVPTSIAMVLMNDNIDHAFDVLALAKKLGVKIVRFIDYIPVGNGDLSNAPGAIRLKDFYIKLVDYERENSDVTVIKSKKIVALIDDMIDTSPLLMSVKNTDPLGCEAGTVLAHIRSDGQLIPCVFFREGEYNCGSLLEQTFEDLWNNSEVLKQFRNLGELPNECNDCSNNKFCRGGCRAYSLYERNSLVEFDARCWRC